MFILLILLLVIVSSCNQTVVTESPTISESFKAHWYDGNAELARYELVQARYGERHNGYAVTITVTEDFLPGPQVKLDHYPNDSAISILKVNHIRQFWTGMYPYNLMMSVFTPMTGQTMKVSTSVQDWCGHVYTQLNFRNQRWNVQSHSYFEKEGDLDFSLDSLPVEDELWTVIRMDPDRLPVGSFSLIPGTIYSRLSHDQLRMQHATATWREADTTRIYSLTYQSIPRSIHWTIGKNSPHIIYSWKETGMNGTKPDTTTARLVQLIRAPYWQFHNTADSVYRKNLMGF